MTEATIICPTCQSEIKLTESLAAPLIDSAKRQFEERLAEKEAAFVRREANLRAQEDALSRAKESLEEHVAARLQAERTRIAEVEARKARMALATDLDQRTRELAELQEVLKQRDAKLAEAQQAQAALLRQQRELEDAKRELDLTVEKRVQESLDAARERGKLEAEEALKLRVTEREQTIAAMQRQIDDLKRRSEQGSQQLQGEALEVELEALLREHFPHDEIEPVPKGEHGGDVLQHVVGPSGRPCGTILWESKRTKNWSDGWLPKLRDDMREAGAEVAVVVSQVLPKGIDTFDRIDGVWVTSYRCALPVAVALRHALVEVTAARTAAEGQQTKMELVYQYLTGSRFRHRVQAIVEKFGEMQEDLDRERKAMTRLWAKREEQIRGVIEATAGMYGDLQGIAGKTLQEIEGLDLRLIESEKMRA